MTSRDRQGDRRAVFERDDHACRHCESAGDAADPTALRTVPVGGVPLEGTVHESALVTVCADCFATLRTPSDSAEPEISASRRDLFTLVRETTRVQGGVISDVASFASLATSVPTMLADDEASFDGETAADYRRARRDVLLAIDIVDARLERLAAVDETAFDADVRSSLEAFSASAADLQSTLRTVVDRAETVPAGLERCHGCFDALESGRCSTCGLEAPSTADWRRDDGGLAFERLFSAVNDELQHASATTETLTDRATALATQLSES
ncbi:HNH endonuclease [Natronorubrum halophilum]|uniref:HNH endonuclease n=1 Tax=Natronorubrum halophilum TaxID=1702106 RepID=UPI0010C18F6C|nr:HNH endonuclease [Natronorubrum halophilum]